MSSGAGLSVESFRPAPERLWIRYRPRHWPSAEGDWIDWSHGTLGHAGRAEAAMPELGDRHLADVVYLPPVREELEDARLKRAESWWQAGTPVLLQLRAGVDRWPGEVGTPVWDALPALLKEELESLARLEQSSQLVWPLIAGVSDLPEVVASGLDALAQAGVSAVQPLRLDLSAAARRQLATFRDDATFDRLFHGPPPSERELARQVAARGMSPFLQRPLPPGPERLVTRRRCSGQLRLAAYLQHRLGRPEVESQRLLRSARWIDRENHDLAGLVESGNLGLVEWLEGESSAVVEDVVVGARTRLVDLLIEEYVGGV